MYRHSIKRKTNLKKLSKIGENYYNKIKNIMEYLLNFDDIDKEIDLFVEKIEINEIEDNYIKNLLEAIKKSPVKHKKQLIKLMNKNNTAIPLIINENEIKDYDRFIELNLSNIYEDLEVRISKPFFISKINKIFVYFVEDLNANCLRIEYTFIYKTKYKELKYTASIDPGRVNIISIYTHNGNGYLIDVDFSDLEIEENIHKIVDEIIKKLKRDDVRYLFIGDKSLRFGTFLCGKYLLWDDWEKKYYHRLINELIEKSSENSIYVMYLDESYSSTIKTPINLLEIKDKFDNKIFQYVIGKEREVEIELNGKKKMIPRDIYSCVFMLNQAGGFDMDVIDNLRTNYIRI